MPNFEERVYALLNNIAVQDSKCQGFQSPNIPVANNSLGSGLVGGNNQDFYGNINDPRPNFGVQYGNGLFYKQMRGTGLIDYNLNRNTFTKNNMKGRGLVGGQGMDSRNLGDLRNRLTDYYIRNYNELGGDMYGNGQVGGIVAGDEKYLYPESLLKGRLNRGGKMPMADKRALEKVSGLYDVLMECYHNLGNMLSELGDNARHDVMSSEKFEAFMGRMKQSEDFMIDLQNQFVNGEIPRSELMRYASQLKGDIKTCQALSKQVMKGHGRSGGSTSVISGQFGSGSHTEKSLSGNYMGYGGRLRESPMNQFEEDQNYMNHLLQESIDYNRAFIPTRPKPQTYLEHDVRERSKNIMVNNELYYRPPITQDIQRAVKEREALRNRAFDQAHQDVKYNVPYPSQMINILSSRAQVETGMGRKRGKGASGGKKKRPMSAWIKHVMDYAQKNGVSYREALKSAGPSFRKGKGSSGGAYC